MKNVFDKIILLIKSRKRYKCNRCNDTGYIVTNIEPEDNNTLGKDIGVRIKLKCNCRSNDTEPPLN